MKRSLMIEKYTTILKMYGYVDNKLMSAKGVATVLLGIAENNGMLAPIALFKASGKGCLCTMRESCRGCGGLINDWEEEND